MKDPNRALGKKNIAEINALLKRIEIANEERGLEAARHEDCFVISCIGHAASQEPSASFSLIYPPFDEVTMHSVAATIDYFLDLRGGTKKLVVYCGFGVERSPLAVAYWLRSKYKMSWDQAYYCVKKIRPEAIDCRAWVAEA